ncbi:uncharacterized protein B0I36DRAFT_324843 [Microdochium trichocladiopsis]|uniref:Transcriptional regulator n=1 Tax=Microdochium trichocladiopsis TaxID=1682393 RepID=A0A9P9BSN1_9PEZI|nr:uncharacterized protein B0I36DRAFT_324843 [Microdochium trichocladiopsis]KAH7029006.1 hypothetical protein B0I36DRAFT_324843 [Microdochium trichocladiopsis]
MAPPSTKILERDLKTVVRELWKAGGDNLTVNGVRKRVEEMHDLDEGFFNGPDWKDRSKTIIKGLVDKLDNGEDSGAEEEGRPAASLPARAKPKASNGIKRSSPIEDRPAAKRQKKAPTAKPAKKRKPAKKAASESELSEEEESEPESDLSEMSEDEEPKPRKRGGKRTAASDSESELSDLGSSEEDEKPKRKTAKPKTSAKPKPKRKAIESESEVDDNEKSVDEGDTKKEKDDVSSPKTKEAAQPEPESKTGDIIDSDSELSSVIDDPPLKKRGKAAAPKDKTKASAAKPTKELSADEEEVKKLQGQLVKCGIRKIWGIELKKYGDDAKAKIRHLRGMLADAGMTGRFSEARAKEIKEQRELMADLEAVTDMNALWGDSATGGRASRSRANRKSLKEASDDDDDDNDDDNEAGDDGDDAEATKANSRVSKRMADLAFLGDESESD